MYDVEHYVTDDGKDVYQTWFESMRDARARLAIARRINRLAAGNFGDHKYCTDGVWELRIDVGAGYRLYYALLGKTLVMLLCGGDKGSQSADIARSAAYLEAAKKELR